MRHPYIERIHQCVEEEWSLPPGSPKQPYPEQEHKMIVVLDSHPWNPIHHAWLRFFVDHATEYIGIDGGFEVYAFDNHDHGFPPYIRSDSENRGDWRWEVSDPARKIVFQQTFTIHVPDCVTVHAGDHTIKFARPWGSRCTLMGGSGTIHALPGSGKIVVDLTMHLRRYTPPPPVLQNLMGPFDWDQY